ncbi:hypothetical protein CEXT_682401 [Caerostris extrusa]|uniref:Uncharacterized protein n=1 Tax=Caerostris extrusa TaxID=172846 RepID=A0AAV4MCH6_CAEEX|nr:hypothetical protein CEXT_682401 [Caerostris extrusa]
MDGKLITSSISICKKTHAANNSRHLAGIVYFDSGVLQWQEWGRGGACASRWCSRFGVHVWGEWLVIALTPQVRLAAEGMAILKTCCCWKSVRDGSFACGIYTMVSSIIL